MEVSASKLANPPPALALAIAVKIPVTLLVRARDTNGQLTLPVMKWDAKGELS